MARNLYGCTSADFTLTESGRVVAGATATVWTARTGGTQITDLTDIDGDAITLVTSDADGGIRFYGVDGDKDTYWLDTGTGARIAVRPVDLTGEIGPTPDLTIGTVTTGTAAATITGTDAAPVLNLTLPSAGANGVDTAAIQAKAVTAAKIADDTITATQIAANAVGASELADNAVDTAAIQDSAVTSAKIADGTITASDVAASTFAAFGTVGNLLTENQATPTTTGAFTLSNCTEGAAGVFTSTATGTYYAYAASLNTITAGETYTATITLSPTGRAVNLLVEWRNSGGSSISSAGTVASATAQTHRLVLTAPTGAVSARVYAYGPGTGSIGDTVTVTKVGLWRGAGGQWQLPGVPVPGQSAIATNNAVHLSGTGTPEGVITAAPGSTWLQTDSTTDVKGWIRWIKATGTGNTGWVVGPEADTGWRQVASWGTDGVITASGVTLTNITAKASTAGSILMRRAGDQVTITIKGAVLATGATLTGMTAGFVRNTAPYMAVPANSTFGVVWAGSNIYYLGAHTTDNSFGSTFVVPMYGIAWPSSLPGSAA